MENLIEKKLNRAVIYFFYDAQGYVDDYNLYLLNDLRYSVNHILVVVNGSLYEDGRRKFEQVADAVVIRENVGFDVWAYKAGIEWYGWEELKKYDELVMLNFTNYGPVYPLKEMFDEMAGRDVDFWGVVMRYGTPHDPYNMCKYGYIPDHISTSFIIIRNRMLRSHDFMDYWENMTMINNYDESVCYHEAIFTEDFKQKGYIADNYIYADDLKEYWDYVLMLFPLELVKNRRCPIFKRKTFYNIYEEFFMSSLGNAALDFYNYLKNETNYDVNMIWDNLLRTENLWDIKQRMQLNYVLSSETSDDVTQSKKTALFFHLSSRDRMDNCRHYARSIPAFSDIYIATDTEEKKAIILEKFKDVECSRLKVDVLTADTLPIFIQWLHQNCAHYDYICIANDDASPEFPKLIGDSYLQHCLENVLCSRAYVNNVIKVFEENVRLGLLVPPMAVHSKFNCQIGNEWRGVFDQTYEIAQRMGISVSIRSDYPPVAPMGMAMWVRPQALEIVFTNAWMLDSLELEHEILLRVIENIIPFAAQQTGHYSAWGTSTYCSKMNMTNYYYFTRDIYASFNERYGVTNRYEMKPLIFADHNEKPKADEHSGIIGEPEARCKSLFKRLLKKIIPVCVYNKLKYIRYRFSNK